MTGENNKFNDTDIFCLCIAPPLPPLLLLYIYQPVGGRIPAIILGRYTEYHTDVVAVAQLGSHGVDLVMAPASWEEGTNGSMQME